jgi:hypothetical protein
MKHFMLLLAMWVALPVASRVARAQSGPRMHFKSQSDDSVFLPDQSVPQARRKDSTLELNRHPLFPRNREFRKFLPRTVDDPTTSDSSIATFLRNSKKARRPSYEPI